VCANDVATQVTLLHCTVDCCREATV